KCRYKEKHNSRSRRSCQFQRRRTGGNRSDTKLLLSLQIKVQSVSLTLIFFFFLHPESDKCHFRSHRGKRIYWTKAFSC
ncbi:hypothetical protein LDENG_00175540, partial [Lucifuga dentata]